MLLQKEVMSASHKHIPQLPTVVVDSHAPDAGFPSQIFKEAQTLLPGGVNSPVRAFRSVGGQPIIFERVKGSHCFDVDNNEYIDYVGSWGPAICGHANDEVNAELIKQIEKGTSFGAPCELEVSFCPIICSFSVP